MSTVMQFINTIVLYHLMLMRFGDFSLYMEITKLIDFGEDLDTDNF